MSVELQIKELDERFILLERVVQFNQSILHELAKRNPPPSDLAQARGFLRSARDLLKHGEEDVAEHLVDQAREAAQPVQQWLAVGDLGVSPFALRTFLSKDEQNGELLLDLIRYFLCKDPHAHNDRDKLDYLLSSYFGAEQNGEVQLRFTDPGELDRLVQDLFAASPPPPLRSAAEIMLHELESLMSRIPEYSDFDQLATARIVERARTLKINLGDDFYHPQALPQLIRFNIAFRRQFEALFCKQLEGIREVTRARIEEAWNLIQAIEEAYEKIALPGLEPVEIGREEAAEPETQPSPGLALWETSERISLDRLRRGGDEHQKEQELAGIIRRISEFTAQLSSEDLQAETVIFPLRYTQLELSQWGWEAFRTGAEGGPKGVPTIQSGLGLLAWLEEELVLYREKRQDRYLSKPHFDRLSYAVARTVELLATVRGLLRQDAPEADAAWFKPLLQLSLRLANAVNHVAPVFAKPAGA